MKSSFVIPAPPSFRDLFSVIPDLTASATRSRAGSSPPASIGIYPLCHSTPRSGIHLLFVIPGLTRNPVFYQWMRIDAPHEGSGEWMPHTPLLNKNGYFNADNFFV